MNALEEICRIGVISDTHGLLRPEAVTALKDDDLIIHAGDIGKPEVLEALRDIAPVHAVRGNIDRVAWAAHLPEFLQITCCDVRILVLHDRGQLHEDHLPADIIISGHSHKPGQEQIGPVLYLNPGSAGPRRFSLPVSLARLEIGPSGTRSQIITLDVAPPKKRKTRRQGKNHG